MAEERLTEKQGRQRLLDAAVELALETGGPDFTVRQVAARAGLNHGLVHRYFGTKDALTSAVIRSIGSDLASELSGSPERVAFVSDRRIHVLALLLTHSSAAHHLDEEILIGIQPVVDALGGTSAAGTSAAGVREGGNSQDGRGTDGPSMDGTGEETADPRTRAALRLATILGWVSNEQLITSACGLGSEQRAELVSLIDSIAGSKVG
ncbi:MAG: TetR/AcrR family transcriptional regulator [Microthrixaceae bacterium]